jgi:hypothetical protein
VSLVPSPSSLLPARETGPWLDPARIVETIATLRDRIAERFPGSGLSRVAEDLFQIANQTVDRLAWAARPHLPLRIGIWALVLLVTGVLASLVVRLNLSAEVKDFPALLALVESGINDVVLTGAAILFLATMEGRVKRNRALGALRELRAVAHIVDMHQLTKDPARMLRGEGEDTPSSPVRAMTRFELARYLDYCSEMLALNSKLAALYAQTFDDPVILGAVDEVEDLTTGLSAKIWQKLVILDQSPL